MTKIFFPLAMLISVAASATVKVTPLSTDYSTNKVTFKVEWTNTPSAPYNNRVWVWIDFCPVTGTTPANSFSAATISNPTRTGGNGTVTNATARGFFIEYAAANAGTTVTATLSNASGKFNWCAYGSDYPPNVLTNTNSSYTLAGTPPFKLITSNGATSLTVPGTTIAASAVTFTPATITDATGYPGLWCPYTGSDLYMDISHRCMQRQSGAQNWEAWIQDARDNKKYRIAQLSTGLWTMDDYLNYTDHSAVVAEQCSAADPNATEYWRNILATTYSTLCPNGWRLPNQSEFFIVAAEWAQYLSKQIQGTGETIITFSTPYCQNTNPNYVSFICEDCLGSGTWGNRLTTYGQNEYASIDYDCSQYTDPVKRTFQFSGYVRCVR
ncbi:MAG: hypothetical protein LBU42_08310 [Prevotellaceae bacterium]|jgi:uncharacterized protein (TIGR02145 family)|nr:hypothetical protein [Prevotellaceae bacterium]